MTRKADPSCAQPGAPFAEFRLVTDKEREQELQFAAVNSIETLPVTLGLSREQRLFLISVAGGNNYTQSAHIAGVARSTFYSWQKHDYAFIAAMNAWRDNAVTAARDHLMGHVGKLVEVVLAAGINGDVRAAMTVLTSLGILAKPPAGSHFRETVRREDEKQSLQEHAERARTYTECHKTLSEFSRGETGKILKKLDEEAKKEGLKACDEETEMLAADEAVVNKILAEMPEDLEEEDEEEEDEQGDATNPPDAACARSPQADKGPKEHRDEPWYESCTNANEAPEPPRASHCDSEPCDESSHRNVTDAPPRRGQASSAAPDPPLASQ